MLNEIATLKLELRTDDALSVLCLPLSFIKFSPITSEEKGRSTVTRVLAESHHGSAFC